MCSVSALPIGKANFQRTSSTPPAYFAASMFNEVFGTAIWTILQCFVADEEMFPKPKDRYAEGSLAALIGKNKGGDSDSDDD